MVDTLEGERVNVIGMLLVDLADVEEGVAVVLNSCGGTLCSDVAGESDGLKNDVSKDMSTGSGRASDWIEGEGRKNDGS